MYSGPQMVLMLFRARKVIMKDVIRVSAYRARTNARSAFLARSQALGSSL